jgi:uncharacterized membrane protein YozB (DUF420 family)
VRSQAVAAAALTATALAATALAAATYPTITVPCSVTAAIAAIARCDPKSVRCRRRFVLPAFGLALLLLRIQSLRSVLLENGRFGGDSAVYIVFRHVLFVINEVYCSKTDETADTLPVTVCVDMF